MKKHLIYSLFVYFIFTGCVLAQDTNAHKGYIGISGGVSIPANGESKKKLGFSLNPVEFGYLLGKNWGVATNLFYLQNGGSNNYSAFGILLGALGSYSLSNRLSINIIPMFGGGITSYPNANYDYYYYSSGTAEDFALAFDFKMRLQYQFSKMGAIALSAECLNTVAFDNDEKLSFNNWTTSLNINLGVFILLK